MTRTLPRSVYLFAAVAVGTASCLGAAGLLVASTALEGQRIRGPWYTDVDGHWARTYIATLWREGVTPPPYTLPLTTETWSRPGPFGPDRWTSPPVFGDMLRRVFPGPPFPPPDVSDELLREQATATGAGGTLPAPRRRVDLLTRARAVEALVRALGLADYAASLEPSKAAQYLGQFHDGRNVPPSYRQAMATAIILGIIQGYPDRTIRPDNVLTNAEAATVLYRSCLLLTDAQPSPFSPDGDGIEETTTIRLGSLVNRNARAWDLFILDASGRVLRDLRPAGAGPAPPAEVVWDGRDGSGRLLPPSVYYYQGWLEDRYGQRHWSARKPISVEMKSLSGYAHPAWVLPSGTVRLGAFTTGPALRVTVTLSSFPEAGALDLRPPRGNQTASGWETVFAVPPGAAPGPCLASFTAHYPDTVRTAAATFTVGEFTVTAQLEPNPVTVGAAVGVKAWPNLDATGCAAVFPWPSGPVTTTLRLAGRTGGRQVWDGGVAVPDGTPSGEYEILVVARRPDGQASVTLRLRVRRAEEELAFVLSD